MKEAWDIIGKLPEDLRLIAYILLAIGAIIMISSKWGLLSQFKKNGNKNAKCPHPEVVAQVKDNTKEIDKLRDTIGEKIFPKINQTAEDVAFSLNR